MQDSEFSLNWDQWDIVLYRGNETMNGEPNLDK